MRNVRNAHNARNAHDECNARVMYNVRKVHNVSDVHNLFNVGNVGQLQRGVFNNCRIEASFALVVSNNSVWEYEDDTGFWMIYLLVAREAVRVFVAFLCT